VTPRQIDLANGAKGIYQMDGDELTLCIADPGHSRPEVFQTSIQVTHTLIVCRRAEDSPSSTARGAQDAPITVADTDGIVWGPSSPKGMQLGIRLEPTKPEYALHEAVAAKLLLRNAGRESISLTMPRLEVLEKFGFDLSVTDDADRTTRIRSCIGIGARHTGHAAS
jgi:hypothetical protein